MVKMPGWTLDQWGVAEGTKSLKVRTGDHVTLEIFGFDQSGTKYALSWSKAHLFCFILNHQSLEKTQNFKSTIREINYLEIWFKVWSNTEIWYCSSFNYDYDLFLNFQPFLKSLIRSILDEQ